MRDWNKDKELIKIGENSDIPYCVSEFKNMLPYYHQQYAAEKARAETAEAKSDYWERNYYALQREYSEYRNIYPKEEETK